MTINTVQGNGRTYRCTHFTSLVMLIIVAGYTSPGKQCNIPSFIFMRVMAGIAGHGIAEPETFT